MARAVAQPLRENGSSRTDRCRRSATPQPARGGVEALLSLQRTVGNRAVSRLVAGARRLARVSVEEVQAELKRDDQFARHYPPWRKIKLQLSNLSEAELLSHFTMSRLKESVAESAIHHRNVRIAENDIYEGMNFVQKALTDPVASTKELIAGELVALVDSPTLKTYAPEGLKGLGGIIEKMELLAPDAFEGRYFASARERELRVTDPLANVDFIKGFVASAPSGEAVRKRVCLRFGSGANLHRIHPAVHEVIHALADVFAPTLFGHDLNEGVTEFITRKVLDEVGPRRETPKYWEKGDAYSAERRKLAEMMEQQRLSEDDILRAYFSFGSMTGSGPREGVGAAIQRFRDGEGNKEERKEKEKAKDVGERAPASSAVLQ